jgi:hypothetical protein
MLSMRKGAVCEVLNCATIPKIILVTAFEVGHMLLQRLGKCGLKSPMS